MISWIAGIGIHWLALCVFFTWCWNRWFHRMRKMDENMERILREEKERGDDERR